MLASVSMITNLVPKILATFEYQFRLRIIPISLIRANALNRNYIAS